MSKGLKLPWEIETPLSKGSFPPGMQKNNSSLKSTDVYTHAFIYLKLAIYINIWAKNLNFREFKS